MHRAGRRRRPPPTAATACRGRSQSPSGRPRNRTPARSFAEHFMALRCAALAGRPEASRRCRTGAAVWRSACSAAHAGFRSMRRASRSLPHEARVDVAFAGAPAAIRAGRCVRAGASLRGEGSIALPGSRACSVGRKSGRLARSTPARAPRAFERPSADRTIGRKPCSAAVGRTRKRRGLGCIHRRRPARQCALL